MDKKLISMGISMMLLKLLEEEPMYGYQMIKRLEQKSNSVFSLKEGTLYPLLHGLVQEDLLTCYEKAMENGRIRKYYELTAKGKKRLTEKETEWDIFYHSVNKVIGRSSYESKPADARS